MADLKDVIAEFRTIGDAMESLGKFDYIYPSEVNFDRGKDMPICILEKHPQVKYTNFTDGSRLYDFFINFYDVTIDSTVKEDDQTVKISDMENLAELFMREFVERLKADPNGKPWILIGNPVAKGSELAIKDNDKLAGINLSFQLKVFTDCDRGTFNY